MEMRNGVWTSEGKADDARKIRRLAEAIADRTTDADVKANALQIIKRARDLEHDL